VWSNNYEVSYVENAVITYFLPVLGENVFLSTQFTVSISPSLNMRDQVSQPQEITGNITFLYPRILIPMTLKIRRREKILSRMVEKNSRIKLPLFLLASNAVLFVSLRNTGTLSHFYKVR
jgi:hypothetical protein